MPAPIYKTVPFSEVREGRLNAVSSSQETNTKAIIGRFITYFKAKHL
tara:strand:+ start:458 stop:598 length:141 start_codon:yes stop_codon:yes gene_type:complete